MTWESQHLSIAIEREPQDVAAFVGNPENLPLWAAGLSSSVRRDGGRWVADSPMGIVEIAFTGTVESGILDHEVALPDGTVIHNPLRVLRNDEGSEVVFTLYRRAGVTPDAFEQDAALIREDLLRLRGLLEPEP